MAKTVVGLFDTAAEAQSVVQELINSGFQRNDISLVANDAKGEYGASRAAGASTVVGAGIGAAAGGINGALVGAGIPEEDAGFYAEGVRRGGTLVLVKSSDDMAQRAYDTMRRYGAVDVDERSGSWRQSGWKGFDSNAEAYTGSTDIDDKWKRSSKVGTTGGAVAGAATGAAIGAAGGPVGMAVGGVAGAVTGAGV